MSLVFSRMPEKFRLTVWRNIVGAGKFIVNKYHRDSENAKALWVVRAKKKFDISGDHRANWWKPVVRQTGKAFVDFRQNKGRA
jgi:hypothetical protein